MHLPMTSKHSIHPVALFNAFPSVERTKQTAQKIFIAPLISPLRPLQPQPFFAAIELAVRLD